MADAAARAAGAGPAEVLVASTGVIGVALDRSKITAGIASASAALSREGGPDAARAIMTTDPFPKEAAVEVTSAAGTFRVGGIAKGSGMIEPLMATMLGVVTTDAAVAPALLQRALAAVTDVTFNAITVDGECSTNDCVFAMASGAAGVSVDEDLYPVLRAAFYEVSRELAIGIVRGGEGATKLITINVAHAATEADAMRVAKTIANSPLVKTAVHGADPNWGRIVAAAGRSGVLFDVGRATVHVGGTLLFEHGLPHDDAAPLAAEHLKGKDVRIDVDLGTAGTGDATVWTCDLSAEYVRINGEYRT
jgi:glutamate N-acetyltransferase/amino-acid N-acetyltransferase